MGAAGCRRRSECHGKRPTDRKDSACEALARETIFCYATLYARVSGEPQAPWRRSRLHSIDQRGTRSRGSVIYFDTSYLVRLYFDDPGADKVRALAATDNVACAAHGNAEMIAAFHRKFREGAISQRTYAALLGQLHAHDEAGAFQWLSPGPETYRRITEVYGRLSPTVFLRAADALHLATAEQNDFRHVYSNDTHLLAAAAHFGIEGRNPIGRLT